MRHVSRTHKVDLDRLFGPMNLDKAIRIKYVHTTRHIADMLTQGSFAQERWTQLTLLYGLMSHQTHSSSHFLIRSSFRDNMSKRPGKMSIEQESAKSNPTHEPCSNVIDGSEAVRKDGRKGGSSGETPWINPAPSTASQRTRKNMIKLKLMRGLVDFSPRVRNSGRTHRLIQNVENDVLSAGETGSKIPKT